MMLLKKTVYDKLLTEVNSIDTSAFVFKTKYNRDKTELEKKIPDTSGLVKKKFSNKENKIPDVISLVNKTDYNTKINEIGITNYDHDKYITTPEFNNLAAAVFDIRLKRANLVTETDFDNKVSSLDSKIAANKTKNESIEDEIKQLKTLHLTYCIGKSHFKEDGAQNYLVFQSLNNYFKVIASTDHVSSWKSKVLSAETIKPPATPDESLTPALSCYGTKTRVKFTRSKFHTLMAQ